MKPLICKARFFLPGPTRHEAARDHLKYIANPNRDDLARWQETLRQRDVESEATIHAMHIHERPGSEGLFGPEIDGPVSEAELERIFVEHEGPVWNLIVSVHHDDAVAELPHLMGRAAWEDACRNVLPRVAENMGIPAKDLRWVAAMHRRPTDGSPHAHILFWSDDPDKGVRQRGGQTYHGISPKALDQAKGLWASYLYGPVRERLGNEKSDLRQEVRTTAWQVLGRTDSETLGQRLADIKEALPGHGRLAYAYMPPELKAKVDAVTDSLLQQPQLAPLAERFGDIAAELATHYSTDPARHEKARQNALEDLRHRLAVGVLRSAATLDQRLAWRAVTDDLWSAVRGQGGSDDSLAVAMRGAVHRVSCGHTTAHEEAQTLLASPELAGHLNQLIQAASKRGDPATAQERQERTAARLAVVLTTRLQRHAEYIRQGRGYWASQEVARLSAAIAATIRQAEREAALAAARDLEEEAARLRAATKQPGPVI